MNRWFKDERGQLSIFLGISMVVVMTFVAFVVNVGLFVKAKINLQNAVDSAAFAGAAVQARQLTNIGYMNWELRNTYKEWMFKYYVLGGMSLPAVQNPATVTGSSMNYRLAPFFESASSGSGYDPESYDRFNVPSICIHFGGSNNICGLYSLPGLPRFNTVGLPNVSAHHEAFLNEISAVKAADCSQRSKVNFATALTWVYGSGDGNLFQDMPNIASHRVGAWLEALEIGMRIRNLEMMVNLPPVPEPICYNSAVGGCRDVGSLDQITNEIPIYERPVKAPSGRLFETLGGAFKAGGNESDPFYGSFKLTELVPNSGSEVDVTTLSGFLIPSGATIADTGIVALKKHYLDLQVYPVNLVQFYTTFVTDTQNNWGSGISADSRCSGSKTALPVPGYIMGFQKNPEILTYYAVKGEADFMGLFYPFQGDGIKLKAYAAAKPFGGKIGPKLFKTGSDNKTITMREDANMKKTAPYISAFVTRGMTFKAGLPIPLNQDFYIESSLNALGGTPQSGTFTKFGIPNLLYTFNTSGANNFSALIDHNQNVPMQELQQATSVGDSKLIREKLGLYDVKQFTDFRANLTNTSNAVFTKDEIDTAIYNVRQPTRYEAMNYLIPIYEEPGQNPDNRATLHDVYENTRVNDKTVTYSLYAPLFGNYVLYKNKSEAETMVKEYLGAMTLAIDAFLDALEDTAAEIRKNALNAQDPAAYESAANSIFANDFGATGAPTDPQCEALSMAGRFHKFFKAAGPECGIVPLANLVDDYFARRGADAGYAEQYTSHYTKPHQDILKSWEIASAYMPGPRQGAEVDGTNNNPFKGPGMIERRNFYSTKFIPITKVATNPGQDRYGNTFWEQGSMENPQEYQGVNVVNLLERSELTEEFGDELFY